MSVFDKDLVKAINSGRCFAIIGSGPSCELGAPSWGQLAEGIMGMQEFETNAPLLEKLRQLLADSNYPKLFSLAEKHLGVAKLMEFIANSFLPTDKRGKTYSFLASWPFANYLTTNFDDYLKDHLGDIDVPVVTRRNKIDDMRDLHTANKNIIFKIHGDATVPQDIVLTEEQYEKFEKAKEREYWRDSILAVLKMVDSIIIGYSASDPDFKEQLRRASKISAPNHPVFMFACGLDTKSIAEYYRHYNIRIIPYNNNSGTHEDLHRLLKRYDPFIPKRGSKHVGLEPIDESTENVAASLYLFTQLRIEDRQDVCISRAYASVILQLLSPTDEKHYLPMSTLSEQLARRTFAASNVDPVTLKKAIESLHDQGFISAIHEPYAIALTSRGRDIISRIRAQRELLNERFHEACRVSLKSQYSEMDVNSLELVLKSMRKGLVRAYEKRGMEIARSVFTNEQADVSGAIDVLEAINKEAGILLTDIQRSAFADLMIEVMLTPGEEMKQFLAALSQGYFAYHALGLEPKCSDARLRYAQGKKWILDSSILLPIIAIDSVHNSYAKDLLSKMQEVGLNCCTTKRLFSEVLDHAWWAITNFSKLPPDDVRVLQAAMAGPGYKQNLFLDGFMKWSLDRGAPDLNRYFNECLGPSYESDLIGAIRKKLAEFQIEVVDFQNWPGFTDELWVERDSAALQIAALRKEHATYRGEDQCVAEAEVLVISRVADIAFLSRSSFLNRINLDNSIFILAPEGMYRLLSMFVSDSGKSDLLYDCMLQDFYFAGFDIVDKITVSKFINPLVQQARMRLDDERENYEKALGKAKYDELKEGFDDIPDEQKPFYSMQFAYYVAERELEKREIAERRARESENVKRLTLKEREDLNKLRAKEEERKRKGKKKQRRTESKKKNKNRNRR